MTSYLPQKARKTSSFLLILVTAILFSACTNSPQSISSPQRPAAEQASSEDVVAYKAELEAMDFLTLIEGQRALEAYMSMDEETKIVTFDKERAKEEGYAASLIALSDEMMAYQNQMMRKMKADGITDVTQVDVSIEPFPLAKMFRERATARVEEARVKESSSD